VEKHAKARLPKDERADLCSHHFLSQQCAHLQHHSNTSPAERMKVFCLFLVALGLINAQKQPSCDAPQQWQASLRRFDQTRQVSTFGSYYYDAVNERISEMENVENKELLTRLWVIELWRAFPPTRYSINMSETPNTCIKEPLTIPFTFIGSGAQYDDDTYFGCGGWPDGGFEAFNSQNNTVNGTLHMTFSTRGCIPIQATRIRNNTNPVDITNYYWSNVVLGIANPNVFVPPPQCK